MKKILLSFVVMSALTGFLGGAYAAEVSSSLDVSTTIGVVCSVQTQGVVFQWDPINGSSANGDITVTCPPNTGYNIALDAGQNIDGDPDFPGIRALLGPDPFLGIAYALFQDPNFSTEWGDSDFLGTYFGGTSLADIGSGSPQPHTVYGALAPEGPGGRPDGSYNDFVGVTVYF